jgi:hypothetical protein
MSFIVIFFLIVKQKHMMIFVDKGMLLGIVM